MLDVSFAKRESLILGLAAFTEDPVVLETAVKLAIAVSVTDFPDHRAPVNDQTFIQFVENDLGQAQGMVQREIGRRMAEDLMLFVRG